MTIAEAIQEVKSGIHPRRRGPASATIIMADGREYTLDTEGADLLLRVEMQDGEPVMVERARPADVSGQVADIRWGVDEHGGIIF